MRLARHYTQAAPCAPGRAALYTGTYQMNNRVVANGTPLDDRFDNVARMAGRAGYAPALFGYTDQGGDPRLASGPDDPRLSMWEGVLPGFDAVLELTEDHRPWVAWLGELGYTIPSAADPDSVALALLASESARPAEHSVSTFLTDALLAWIDRQDGPWFAHAIVPAPASAVRRRRGVRHDVRPRRLPGAGADPGAGATRCTTWCSASPRSPPRPTRRRWPACRRSTSG